MATRINFVDLYSFYNELDSFVIEAMMADNSISCSVRSLSTRFSEGETDDNSELRMSVEESSLDNARRIIYDAIRRGVISRQGEFRF